MNDTQPSAAQSDCRELPWLVGDVGGTHARFGWVDQANGRSSDVRTWPVRDFAGPAEAVAAYLADLAKSRGGRLPPARHGSLALATPISGDAIAMTNSAWRFSRSSLQSALGLETLVVLNDFEALALALPGLQASQLRWRGLAPRPGGTMAVIGPGTGLGAAGVVHTPLGWVALPGEGGHVTLAAADDFEARLLERVRRTQTHVSAERLLSGIGLPLLHGALADLLGLASATLSAQQIIEAAADGADALCVRTLDVFCALLGGYAGNVALTLGARGGVYIGGGIVPRLGERFFASRFRERFEAKGRYRGYLQVIPTPVIVDTLAALGGAVQAIRQRLR